MKGPNKGGDRGGLQSLMSVTADVFQAPMGPYVFSACLLSFNQSSTASRSVVSSMVLFVAWACVPAAGGQWGRDRHRTAAMINGGPLAGGDAGSMSALDLRS